MSDLKLRKKTGLSDQPYELEHRHLAFAIKQARVPWGSNLLQTIALNTYRLDDEAMEVIHPLTWAR